MGRADRTTAVWSAADIPDLTGQVVLVTGANSRIGFETAGALAGAGATAVMACRNLEKAKQAQRALEDRQPRGTLELLRIDLADQGQIAAAAVEAGERFPRIDRLINNAGVMSLPRSQTVDGFETVFGTNHLGHFAFTCRLLPTLLATPGSRVVTVSSLSHHLGRISWDNLDASRGPYLKSRAYAQSKLANLLFSLELNRRLEQVGARTSSLGAHPGFASTEILGATIDRFPKLKDRLQRVGDRYLPAANAALPALRAATSPDARGGEFYGPSRWWGITGPPAVVKPGSRALDADLQTRLWRLSAALTGVDFPPA